MVRTRGRPGARREIPRLNRARFRAAGMLLCLLACAGGAFAASPPQREIRVVTDINYPPYLFQSDSGELQGILKDKWELWSRRTGIRARLEGMEWIKAQESVLEGSADVIEALSYTPRRALLYEYSPAYAPIEARVYFHRSISGINDVQSMRGFAIGAKEGSACAGWLAERDIEVDSLRAYPTSEMLIRAAGVGEVRLFCMDAPAARYFLFKHRLADEFRETPPLYSAQFHWAVKKGRTELRDSIQGGFERIAARELEDIDRRWLGAPLSFHVPERYLYYLAFLAAAVLGSYALLVAWNRTLRSRVSLKTAELSGALETLQAYTDKVRDLYNNAPCGYHSLDKDGTFVEINDTELAWLGYTRKEVIGKLKFTDLLTDAGQQGFRRDFDRLKDLGSLHDLEHDLLRKDGSTLSVLVSVSAVRGADGKFLMSRATLYDITERKRAEGLLQQSEDRFHRIFDNSPYPMAMTRLADLKLVEANEAALALFAYSREEVIGKTTRELNVWERAEDQEIFLRRVNEQKKLRDLEARLRDGRGNLKDMLISAEVIELKGEAFAVTTLVDITERKRAERLLQESEARLTKIIEASPEAITIVSVEDDTFVAVNPAGERLCGYTREQMIGKSALDLGLYLDPEERRAIMADLQRNEAVRTRELRLRRKDGEVRDVLGSAALIDFRGRKLILFQASDITERKRAERLLQESERRLATIIRASPQSISITNADDGTYLEVNPACERQSGYTREELIGKSAIDLGFWPDLEERRRFVSDLRRDGIVQAREVQLRHKSGLLRELLASAALIEIEGRQVMLFQGVDVTDRRRAERLLEESERRLARMIEASPEAITIGSMDDGRFVQVNPACESLTGYSRDELIGHSPTELGFWPVPEERARFVEDLRRQEVVHGRALRLRRKNGEERSILASAAQIDIKGRKFILFQAVDITEQMAAEQALKEQELVLRELSAHHDAVREGERAHIAREIHDELGQALTALKMELSVVNMKFGETAPKLKEPVEDLKNRVDAIIQTVRDVATALRPAALDLGFLPGVEWLVEEFRRRSGIRCTVSLAGKDIVLSEERGIVLFRILQESLTNISRHANARKVEILLDHDAENVRLDVQDDGDGFDVQAARDRKTFGLLGMKERAIMLQGDMNISSAPGQGTRVSVSMRIA